MDFDVRMREIESRDREAREAREAAELESLIALYYPSEAAPSGDMRGVPAIDGHEVRYAERWRPTVQTGSRTIGTARGFSADIADQTVRVTHASGKSEIVHARSFRRARSQSRVTRVTESYAERVARFGADGDSNH